ncbi:unnamed protein product [Caenorhabditis angaria]|uniref:Uncharacterized protein n=1 Tax=Caenorhabditis angaria TaxID=860376 RepID=A0A9P1IJM4_9PELO|nr:unnamed protein product [Caenorhabditis angaria]
MRKPEFYDETEGITSIFYHDEKMNHPEFMAKFLHYQRQENARLELQKNSIFNSPSLAADSHQEDGFSAKLE